MRPDQEPYKQLPMMPVYVTEDKTAFYALRDAAQAIGKATADKTHRVVRQPQANDKIYHDRGAQLRTGACARTTLLKEVRAIVKQPHDEIKQLLAAKPGKEKVYTPSKLAKAAVDAMLGHIERHWDSAARHVVMHSSGYDTRLVAGLLRELHKKHGDDWLGEVRFCCFEPEIKHAKAIFDHTGWPQHMWFPVDEGAPGEDYFKSCFDFEVLGKHVSEASRVWGGMLLTELRLEEAGYVSGPMQGLSACFSDETNTWNRCGWPNIGWFVGCYWFDNPGILPGHGEIPFVFPFACAEWLRLITRYYVPVPMDEFKLLMVNELDPGLADIEKLPNWRFEAKGVREKAGGHIFQQKISAETAQWIEDQYRASWYAKMIGPATLGYDRERHFEYNNDERNRHFIAAAIYEQLLKDGIGLR